jgi:hypothetical protein
LGPIQRKHATLERHVETVIQMKTFIPMECYGRWIDIIKRVKHQPDLLTSDTLWADFTAGPTQDDSNSNPNDFTNEFMLPFEELPACQVTAQWLKKVSELVQGHAKAYLKDQKAPVEKLLIESDFMIPVDVSEHKEVIKRHAMAGSTKAEAEQVIAARKKAFKKATSLYKKSASKTLIGGQKKVTNIRKLAAGSHDNYGN